MYYLTSGGCALPSKPPAASVGNANKPKPINIPDGAPVDGGNTIWFADGNELTYSGVRDPATGAVCLGVRKQTGERTDCGTATVLSSSLAARCRQRRARARQQLQHDGEDLRFKVDLLAVTNEAPVGRLNQEFAAAMGVWVQRRHPPKATEITRTCNIPDPGASTGP
ncbi:MAG TPA: hypothetical protein VIY90_24510 [Steroidobacteraceae bacterium]